MKTTRLLFLNFAAAGFLCLPVVSAYAAAPQDQNQNSNTNHGENRGQTNHEQANHQHGNNAQEHRNTQAEHNAPAGHMQAQHNTQAQHNGNYAQQQRGHDNNAEAVRNRGNQRTPTYHFRQQDTQRLRQDYDHSNYRHEVNTRNRAHLNRGGYLPNGWYGHMHRLPPQYLGGFPAPPPGYLIGYYDGYAVVYNPNTGLILEVVNVY